MTRGSRAAFLALVLAQAAHSIEEYATRLYDLFPPARSVSGLVSADRRVGFLIFNVSLLAFGLWCFFGPVLHGWPSARGFAWFWAVLELSNLFVHVGWAISAGAYRPGVATAPVLGALSLLLMRQLRREAG